jgi:hypothetical protein
MRTILDTAETWFLESFSQGPYTSLVIRLCEGRVSSAPEAIRISEEIELGPGLRVDSTPSCRVVEVVFEQPFAVFALREQFDSSAEDLVFEDPSTFIRVVEKSAFRGFATDATGLFGTFIDGIREYHLWTEEQIFRVFTDTPPVVTLLDQSPDESIQRAATFLAGKSS